MVSTYLGTGYMGVSRENKKIKKTYQLQEFDNGHATDVHVGWFPSGGFVYKRITVARASPSEPGVTLRATRPTNNLIRE